MSQSSYRKTRANDTRFSKLFLDAIRRELAQQPDPAARNLMSRLVSLLASRLVARAKWYGARARGWWSELTPSSKASCSIGPLVANVATKAFEKVTLSIQSIS